MKKRLIALLALVLLAGGFFAVLAEPAFAVQPDEILPDAKLEQRARKISADLRCLVCQNQSIDDSDATLAKDLRILVREHLKAGESDSANSGIPGRALRQFHPAQAALRLGHLAALADPLRPAGFGRVGDLDVEPRPTCGNGAGSALEGRERGIESPACGFAGGESRSEPGRFQAVMGLPWTPLLCDTFPFIYPKSKWLIGAGFPRQAAHSSGTVVMAKSKSANSIDKHIGMRVRRTREFREMSQEAFAIELGLSLHQVKKFEGGFERVGASQLAAICKCLQVRPSFFFADLKVRGGAKSETSAGAADDVHTDLSAALDAMAEQESFREFAHFRPVAQARSGIARPPASGGAFGAEPGRPSVVALDRRQNYKKFIRPKRRRKPAPSIVHHERRR